MGAAEEVVECNSDPCHVCKIAEALLESTMVVDCCCPMIEVIAPIYYCRDKTVT